MDNTNEEVVQLYLDDIIPNRFQPREIFDDQALKELAVSIREHGVIQPILVRKFGEKYEIIAGERRYKASTMAGLTKIPAIIKNLDDKEASKVALIENLQRRDLTPVEEARTYQKILDLDEMTQEQLAKTMGKSQSAVSNKLRLLTLPDEVQEALLNNKISERHARSLLNAPKSAQVTLLKEVIDNKMTVRDLDNKIKEVTGTGDSDETSGGITNTPNNNFSIDNGGNMNSYDPTAVDINKIREQSVDINVVKNDPLQAESKNIDSLLTKVQPENNSMFENRFIPENRNVVANNLNSGNEGIGSGLLAGMPVIQDTQNNESSIFSTPVVEPTPVVEQPSNNANSLFSTPMEEPIQLSQPIFGNTPNVETVNENVPAEQPINTDVNSLFSTPAPEQVPINKEEVKPNETPVGNGDNKYAIKFDLSEFELNPAIKEEVKKEKLAELNPNNTNEQETNPVVAQPEVTSNPLDITAAVTEIKMLTDDLTQRGYSVRVDELNLDNEVQLIVRINKG